MDLSNSYDMTTVGMFSPKDQFDELLGAQAYSLQYVEAQSGKFYIISKMIWFIAIRLVTARNFEFN
jgi:hypothetical protein